MQGKPGCVGSRRNVSLCGRFGSEEVWNASGCQIFGLFDPVARIRVQHRPKVRRREQFLGGHRVGPRSPMRIADLLTTCRTSLPSLFSDTPSKSGNRLRKKARRRDVAGDGCLDGRHHGDGSRNDDDTPIGDTPHALSGSRASRMAPAAFWSLWADALQMIHHRGQFEWTA